MPWLRRIEPLARPLVQAAFRWRRGMTLGVRGVVRDAAGQVLLVEHTYVHGWHLPGGGVERGEGAEQALARELQEEAGVRLLEPPVLVAVFNDEARFRGDHVLIYRAGAWAQTSRGGLGEILGVGWFDAEALPPGVGAATRWQIAAALGLKT